MIFRDGQQARTNVNVFSFFSFFEKQPKMKGFSGQVEEKNSKDTSKSVLNLFKSLNSINLNAFGTCHTSKNQHKWFSKNVVCFHKQGILKGFSW